MMTASPFFFLLVFLPSLYAQSNTTVPTTPNATIPPTNATTPPLYTSTPSPPVILQIALANSEANWKIIFWIIIGIFGAAVIFKFVWLKFNGEKEGMDYRSIIAQEFGCEQCCGYHTV